MNRLRVAILAGVRRPRLPRAPLRGSIPRGRANANDGLAFSQLREYVQGDDPRRIDHAATARAGTLQTRVYVEEIALTLGAIVDESGSMFVGRKRRLADAAQEAVREWFGALEGDDRAARIVDERVIRDRRAAPLVRASEPFDFARALALAMRALPRGASLLAIADGFDLPDDEALARAALRFDATILLARDPWRDDLPLRGIVRLRDAETGRVRRVFVDARVRARYREAAHAREARLYARLRDAGWRVGVLEEVDGRVSLLRAFGIA